jgi:predicted ATP-grasp superfamily ATP-dependent carboligase
MEALRASILHKDLRPYGSYAGGETGALFLDLLSGIKNHCKDSNKALFLFLQHILLISTISSNQLDLRRFIDALGRIYATANFFPRRERKSRWGLFYARPIGPTCG